MRFTSAELAVTESFSVGSPFRSPTVGDQVGRYRIVGVLGAGGMGVVYDAVDPVLERRVALKVIGSGRGLDGRARAAFMSEARALARFSHPNIVRLFDFGRFGDELYLVMERVDGRTADAWGRSRPRSFGEAWKVFSQAADALAAAHDEGLVHRDFKPQNLLVDGDGHARVCDFGLASIPEETGGGRVEGTPRYMSPEQRAGHPIDARSDQYSFCLAVWEVVEGRGVEPPLAKRLPERARRALLRGLSRDPLERFASMRDLARAMRPRRRALGLIGLGVAAVGAVVAASSIPQPCPIATPVTKALPSPAPDSTRARVDDALGRYRRDMPERAAAACRAWDRDPVAARAAVNCLQREHAQYEAVAAMLHQRDAAAPRLLAAANELAQARCGSSSERAPAALDQLSAAKTAWLRGDLDAADRRISRARRIAASLDDDAVLAEVELFALTIDDARGVGELERRDRMHALAYHAASGRDVDIAAKGLLVAMGWAACAEEADADGLGERAWAAVVRAGWRREHVLQWLVAHTRRLACSGDLDGALATAREARAAASTSDDVELLVLVLRELAMTEALSHSPAAGDTFDELVDASKRAFGVEHPTVAEDRLIAAEVHAAMRRPGAVAAARRAMADLSRSLDVDAPGYFVAQQRVARIEYMGGEKERAMQRLRGLLGTGGSKIPEHEVARLQRNLAKMEALAGNVRAARELAEAALPATAARHGPRSREVLDARYTRARAILKLEAPAIALAVAREVLADAEALHGRGSPVIARELALLGEALVGTGERVDAIAVLERAWALQPDPAATPSRSVRIALALARAHAETEPAASRRWLGNARELTAATGNAAQAEIHAIEASLAS